MLPDDERREMLSLRCKGANVSLAAGGVRMPAGGVDCEDDMPA